MKIYRDDREKYPWDFSFYGFEQETIRLDVGDYYVEELPDLIIERKRNTGEIAMNLGSKWKLLEKEFYRMADYNDKYIICEFPMSDLDIFPINSGIPDNLFSSVRMNSSYIKAKLFGACTKHKIEILFFNNASEAQASVVDIIKNKGKLIED